MALHRLTGGIAWVRDVANDISFASNDVRQIRIDQNGDIVCMMDPVVHSGSRQANAYFVVVDSSGNLVTTRTFIAYYFTGSAPVGTIAGTHYIQSFAINSAGDYHIIGTLDGSDVAPFQQPFVYEWLSPFSSPPTMTEMYNYNSPTTPMAMQPNSIEIVGGADVLCGTKINSVGYSSFSWIYGPSTWRAVGPLIAVGGSGAMYNDWTQTTNAWPFPYGSFYSSPSTRTTVAPTGTTQAGATLVTAGQVVYGGATPTGGWILDTGTAGDVVTCWGDNNSGGGKVCGTFIGSVKMYPPSGGTINGGAVDSPVFVRYGDFFVCGTAGNWWQFGQLESGQALRCCGNGTYFYTTENVGTKQGVITQYDSSMRKIWAHNQKAVCPEVDSSGNVYAVGAVVNSNASIMVRDNTGAWLWGHKHMAAQVGTVGNPVSQNTIQMDPGGNGVIISGHNDAIGGPCLAANDLNFVSDPDFPTVTIGRTATATVSGAAGNQSIGFTGGASTSGKWLVAVITCSSTNPSGDGVISGGSGWTQMVTDASPTARVFYKQCGGSEPSTYTIAYSGIKGNGMRAIVTEFTTAASTNPVDHQYNREQDHSGAMQFCPSATSANANSASILACALTIDGSGSATGIMNAPNGYVMQAQQAYNAVDGTLCVVLAVQIRCGAGTITPENFTDSGSGSDVGGFLSTTIIIGP